MLSTRLVLRIAPEDLRLLRDAAQHTGLTVSSLVREVVLRHARRAVRRPPVQRPRQLMIPRDRDATA